MYRVGLGYDVHKFAVDRDLIIGGVKIDYDMGLDGYSDADVLIHAIMDAILGSISKRDIGYHFPDNSEEYKDIDSRILLRKVSELLKEEGYEIVNIDSVIIAQNPKMSPYIENMRENIADDLNIDVSNINVKATTTEKLGFEGREEGISSQAIVMIKKIKI